MTPLLSVSRLTRRYGAHPGCGNGSFDLDTGEVTGIVGESGSGKSMPLNCVAGRTDQMLDDPQHRYIQSPAKLVQEV